jgi:transposase
MRATILLQELLGLQQTQVQGFEFTETGLVVDVAPRTRSPYCAGCCRRCRRGYDGRERTWRHVDLGGIRVELRYEIRRVDCLECGVTTELVPWADHGSWFSRAFEDQVAFLAQKTDRTAVSTVMRVSWRTVGKIIARVMARKLPPDLLEGVTRIGIDELSVRRHHEYITVVTNHDTGKAIWAKPGRNAATVQAFFDELGEERAARLELVTLDLSASYIAAVKKGAPQARHVYDRFHVQRLAHDALDQVRREQVRELKGTEAATSLKKTRFALQKNPWNLEQSEKQKLAEVKRTNLPLYRAYLLKESLAAVLDGRQVNVARRKLGEWIDWAQRSRLEPFCKVGRTLRRHLEGILAYVQTGLSNGPHEGLNGKIRTLTRRSYGFHDPRSLIAMVMLCCAGVELAPLHRTPTPAVAARA